MNFPRDCKSQSELLHAVIVKFGNMIGLCQILSGPVFNVVWVALNCKSMSMVNVYVWHCAGRADKIPKDYLILHTPRFDHPTGSHRRRSWSRTTSLAEFGFSCTRSIHSIVVVVAAKLSKVFKTL